jgi:ADP-ribosylglycohydrolase
MDLLNVRSRVEGCLMGGALGDALGGPVEFHEIDEILDITGGSLVRNFVGIATITDDTQMTLFSCEGLLGANLQYAATGVCHPPSALFRSYLHWLVTQGDRWDQVGIEGETWSSWLADQPVMQRVEAPGVTCLSALRSGVVGRVEEPLNDSKGCGGIMRAAPAAFLDIGKYPGADLLGAHQLGCEVAAVTHGHRDGIEPAGFLAMVIAGIFAEHSLERAVELALAGASEHLGAMVERAIVLGERQPPEPEQIERELGGGWVADEALAIALSCAWNPSSVLEGLASAVTHTGDSDSTGAICGNILGAIHGADSVPESLTSQILGIDMVETIVDDVNTWLGISFGAPNDAPNEDAARELMMRYFPGGWASGG